MTPPDSGERCKWIVNGERSGRCVLRSNHAGAHEPDDPRDSGEREVQCGYGKVDCVVRGEVAVHVPVPLAQRILAALETPSIFGSDHRVDLARELRAAVERKP